MGILDINRRRVIAMDNTQTLRHSRMAGVLMPVASLPSNDGIGGFGAQAYRFIDIIADMGMKIWQILPLNPLGYGNSPYQPFSSYAGDELYIDLDKLRASGYISSEKLPYSAGKPDKIDYEKARKYKQPYLREAYVEFWKKDSSEPEFQKFITQKWVYEYAVFMAIKKKNGMVCWNTWSTEEKNWILDRQYDISDLKDEIQYQTFIQYFFYKQWKELKEYANEKGILIMGDVPFYVGIDSLDVWSTREDFLINSDGHPIFIAGVPPDYFSVTGQRWGNPIYNWSNMEKNSFTFWINRLKYSNELYDIVRVDHFRAFDTYWKIPAECETAEKGEWILAPGYEVLDAVFKAIPKLWMVAEDLGDLRPEVLTLRDHYKLAGMNIGEFSVLSDDSVENQVIYTGTHDNQTVRGWYNDCDADTKKKIRKKLHIFGNADLRISHRMISYICGSKANMAIIPVMDLIGENDNARLNTPGTVGSPNWEWKLDDFSRLETARGRIRRLIHRTKRD